MMIIELPLQTALFGIRMILLDAVIIVHGRATGSTVLAVRFFVCKRVPPLVMRSMQVLGIIRIETISP